MRLLKRLAGLTLGLVALLAIIIGTMRLGWWNFSYEAVKQRQAGPPSRFIKVGDATLHVRDEGKGPVIVMLHSSMTNLRLYDQWADQLKGSYRVIRFDWPPYGLTQVTKPSTGMAGVVKLLEAFADQQKLDKFTLVGSSSGATISVLYAAAHPERVQALALSTLPLNAPPQTEFDWQTVATIWAHTNLVPNYYPKFYYQRSLEQLYGEPSRLKPETVQWYYETNNIDGGFAHVGQYYQANKKSVWAKGADKEAAMIKVPVLLQWGDRDPVLAAPLADKAVAQFKNASVKLIHYPDVSHYPMIELPIETGRDLKAFLDRVTAPEAASKAAPEPAK